MWLGEPAQIREVKRMLVGVDQGWKRVVLDQCDKIAEDFALPLVTWQRNEDWGSDETVSIGPDQSRKNGNNDSVLWDTY